MINTNDFLSPLVLTSDSFTLTADGAFAAIRPDQLLNPNNTPMLIDEIRIAADTGSSGIDSVFAQVLLDLKLGSIPLTNGAIPIRSFMPTYSRQSTGTSAVTGTVLASDFQLTWHLPRPMFVPPNVQLQPTVYRKVQTAKFGASIAGANVPFLFTVAGRSVPSDMPVPDKIYVPWACATSVYTTDVPFTSKNNEIVNPHDEPLNMSYLCGFQQNPAVGNIKIIPTPTVVQATFSNNKILIRDPTPFYSLFPPDRPAMRMSGLLQPKQFATFTLDLPTPDVPNGYTSMIFTTIGLCGYRQIDTPKGSS